MRDNLAYQTKRYEKLLSIRKAKWGKDPVWFYKKPRKLVLLDRKIKRVKRRMHNAANPKIRDYQLYALKLEKNKYYIGMTSYQDVMKRFEQHAEGGKYSAQWTKIYKPIEVIETRQLGQVTESFCCKRETEMTIEYMNKYGIDNVRGGALCMISKKIIQEKYSRYSKATVTKPVSTSSERTFTNNIPHHIRAIMNEV